VSRPAIQSQERPQGESPADRPLPLWMAANSHITSFLLNLLDAAYYGPSWHGPALKGTITRVRARQAAAKPDQRRKCIWEQVLHAAYWKYTVRRRLLGEKRGSFPLKGSNWLPMPPDRGEASWRATAGLLEYQHQALRKAVAGMPTAKLNARAPGSKLTNQFVIVGIAYHDIYHAGQIQLLKRLNPAG
jgi:hypothetical protein